MELWIRTQDRMRLIKPNRLAIKGESKLVGLGDWYITESQNSLRYATYPTKKRALEVLDEIHQRLINLQIIEITGADYITNQMKRNGIDCVYEMPKE